METSNLHTFISLFKGKEEAEERMKELFYCEPLGEVELIGWECVCKDMIEGT